VQFLPLFAAPPAMRAPARLSPRKLGASPSPRCALRPTMASSSSSGRTLPSQGRNAGADPAEVTIFARMA